MQVNTYTRTHVSPDWRGIDTGRVRLGESLCEWAAALLARAERERAWDAHVRTLAEPDA